MLAVAERSSFDIAEAEAAEAAAEAAADNGATAAQNINHSPSPPVPYHRHNNNDDGDHESVADKTPGFDGLILPPPAPDRAALLECPEALDKAGRTAVHGIVRAHMPYLSTRAIMPGTEDLNGGGGREGENSAATYLEVTHSSSRRGGRQSWPKDRGEYLEFSVYKAGRSTNEAADALCRRLGVLRGRFVSWFWIYAFCWFCFGLGLRLGPGSVSFWCWFRLHFFYRF